TARKTQNTTFSSKDIRPRALFSSRMLSAPPGRCVQPTLNLILVRESHARARRMTTIGTAHIIHVTHPIHLPQTLPSVAERPARGGVPMSVPRPPMVAA